MTLADPFPRRIEGAGGAGAAHPDCPGALAADLVADPAALDRIGERARQRVRGDFDAQRNFKRWFELLDDHARRPLQLLG